MAHTHYKGTGKIHSFRGLLVDGGQEKIRIQGPVGAIAWRITKFEIMTKVLAGVSVEHTVKIYREEQSSIDNTVDFTDDELLAAGATVSRTDAYNAPLSAITIFDNSLFVRNIWVTNFDGQGSEDCNYYIELEEVKVSKAGMAQLAVAAARRTID